MQRINSVKINNFEEKFDSFEFDNTTSNSIVKDEFILNSFNPLNQISRLDTKISNLSEDDCTCDCTLNSCNPNTCDPTPTDPDPKPSDPELS